LKKKEKMTLNRYHFTKWHAFGDIFGNTNFAVFFARDFGGSNKINALQSWPFDRPGQGCGVLRESSSELPGPGAGKLAAAWPTNNKKT